jgi:glutamine phosphoribosylpyrophosphate amidotransferase
MCGIVGVISQGPVNQLIYDALLLLQHRGQDAAGIVTMQDSKCFMHKARGMVRDVFRTRNMRGLPGNVGLGQVRYPTAGNAYSEEEAQPFYVNAPFGIVLVHNGNLTNAPALKTELVDIDRRHINTQSDTEVLINVLAHELEVAARGLPLSPQVVFNAVRVLHKRWRSSPGMGCWPFATRSASARCALAKATVNPAATSSWPASRSPSKAQATTSFATSPPAKPSSWTCKANCMRSNAPTTPA